MNNNSVLEPTPSHQEKPLSPLLIGIIVISIVAGIGLLGLSFLFFRKRNSNNKHDVESNNNNKKRVFSFSSSSNSGEKLKDVPVTSSLDNQDVFFTLLEYPPTQPPTSLQNNRLLDIPTTANTTCSSYSAYEDRRKLLNMSDPISASLARQSIEERSGYYKSPTRTPVPYYQHKKQQETSSIITSSSNSHHLMINNDEDKEAMQRWSTTSYHVW